jgi:hypothetical protein
VASATVRSLKWRAAANIGRLNKAGAGDDDPTLIAPA